MKTIGQKILDIKKQLPPQVNLVAVSKFQPNESIVEAYENGQRHFGENYVQELCDKAQQLPQDIQWHFIGHLQSNKVKYIAPFVSMIHSVDSKKLLEEIEKQAAKHERVIDVLLQVHVAQEETKSGLSSAKLDELLSELNTLSFPHIRFCGIMGMASFSDDQDLLEREFNQIHALFQKAKQTTFSQIKSFQQISMGMSSDWPLAVKCGSTLIRVGSSLFGERKK